MNPRRHILLSAAAAALLGSSLAAQVPRPIDAPPWWGVSDDRTLSLYFDFSGSTPLTPQVIGTAPAWYNPNNTFAVVTGPLQVIPTLAGHTDVFGLPAAAAPGLLALTVDNDPHLNWVKIFYFQFDAYEGTGGAIAESVAKDLQKYGRSAVVWDSVPLASGWETVTVMAELWPQPDDEELDFSFTADAISDIGIDNLFVNSKCIKVDDADAGGSALGDVDAAFGPGGLDLLATTGSDCQAVAVTEDPLTLLRTYWVSALATGPGLNHQLYQLDPGGAVTNAIPLPLTSLTAPQGVSDLAVVVRRPTPLAAYVAVAVYGLVYRANGAIELVGYDLTGTPLPNLLALLPPLPPADYGLAYNPSGELGSGTFVITDPTVGQAYEISAQSGQLLDMFQIPVGTTGAGYDHVFGNYYFWSQDPNPTSAGPLRTNGVEFSAFDLQPTGARFWGNLAAPNPGGVLGGIASGLEVYRRQNGEFKIACVVRTSSGNRLYELDGPFRYGRSLLGRTGMTGLPFPASANFTITLQGIRPAALFATLYVGFSNTAYLGFTMPFDLAPYGFDESQVLAGLDLRSGLIAQAPNGEFRFPMPVLPQVLSGVPLYFQWLVFDPSVQNGLAMSKAGKTVIY